MPSPDLAPNSVHFKSIDPDSINLGSLKQWPGYCNEHHAKCRPASSQPPAKNIILIDTENHCLVQFPVAPRYTTLSYVWGILPDTLETRLANFPSLKLPNALLAPHVLSRLPKTIRDAIKVTRELGERYLWVDRLCIVQDDVENKAQQIASMASIYANSYFTITAADGADADSGLQGISVPRKFTQPPVLELDPHCHMRPGPETEEARYFTPWHNRGWTFQERLLSTKSLVFFRGSVLWQCKTSIWAEGVAGEPDGTVPDDTWQKENKRPAPQAFDRRFMLQLESFSKPNFPQYESLVRQYCRRKLSYQSDGIRAFSGILDVLSQTYEGGFLHGLPAMFFDMAMLWDPYPGAKPRVVAPGSEKLLFPSWSWAAWEGKVGNNYSDDMCRVPPCIDVYPVVKWCHVEGEGARTNFVNSTGYFMHQIRLRGNDVTDLDLSIFTTPTVDMNKMRVDESEWNRLLHGNVMRAFVRLRPAKEEVEEQAVIQISWEEKVPPFVEYRIIGAKDEKTMGWLKVPSASHDKALLGEVAVGECIVISESKAHGPRWKKWLRDIYYPEWNEIEGTTDAEEYGYYNVLWVEWRDGIAYRKGIGRVWKEGWHQLDVETRDVVLG